MVDARGPLIFAVTYLLLSSRRLSWLGFDRPAAALLGAVACVAAGVLTPREALAAVDDATILLLFGVMGMGAFLSLDGFFEGAERALVARAGTPSRLLGMLIWGSGLLAAWITNDAVCVLGAPLVVGLIRRHHLPPAPFLLGLATAANTGSVATLVGNPQNMLCGLAGGLGYLDHLTLMAPVAVLGLAMNHALVAWLFRVELRGARLGPAAAPRPWSREVRVDLVVLAATVLAYSLGADLPWTATAGFVALMLLHRRSTAALWPRLDWSLLLFFAGLFVTVEGLTRSGLPAAFFQRFPLAAGADLGSRLHLSGVFLLGSNLVSNVPFILVVRPQMGTLADPRLAWELLAMASTFAGNLTLLGSVANVIVAESARDLGGLGFFDFLRVGLPLALGTTLVGTLWLVAVG